MVRKGCILCCVLMAACAAALVPSHAQSIFSVPRPQGQAESLARTSGFTTIAREKSGTAFFVDELGHMLTAGHAANDCIRMIVAKEGQVVEAHVVVVSSKADLALIKVPTTLGLSAVFPRSVTAGANDLVFAAAYDKLAALMSHGGMLANATVASNNSETGDLAIYSNVTFGASGAPVLDSRGLVQGVISRRTEADQVLAVGAAVAKTFLRAHGVAFYEDDRPQIAAAGSRANRAASISARVTCLQN
jgi:S1-C subfamily serine protease